jgi:BirA family biotin operon repressor/biotin-[acetyl-CoA-carboxylase] ligase
VAVCDPFQDETPDELAIKWPNDVLIDGAKVCGILIESPGGPAPAKDRVVIGVGINVNNTWYGASYEAGPNGAALHDFTGRSHDVDAILIAFVDALDRRLHQLGRNDPDLPRAWQHLSWLNDRQIEVEVNGSRIAGKCIGIADDGALLVAARSTTERIYSGSVFAAIG